jgi:hypothetical protein
VSTKSWELQWLAQVTRLHAVAARSSRGLHLDGPRVHSLSLNRDAAQRIEEIIVKRIIRLVAGVLFICASSAAMAQSADGGMRIAVVSMETRRPLE